MSAPALDLSPDSQLALFTPPRRLRLAMLVLTCAGAIGLSLLAAATANSGLFARHFNWLVLLNGLVVVLLFGLVLYQLWRLILARRGQIFGAKLSTRLVLFFALMAIVPGLLLYAISARFLGGSIESWFDVKVERGLDAGLQLARNAVQQQQNELAIRLALAAREYAATPVAARPAMLATLRERHQFAWVGSFNERGLLERASGESNLLSTPPSMADFTSSTVEQAGTLAESLADGVLIVRAGMPLGRNNSAGLQAAARIPKQTLDLATAVEAGYKGYQNVSLTRDDLQRLYGWTLGLTLLMALASAFALAFIFAERFARPLYRLAAGTRAVAQGDFSARQPVETRDELGVLTQSFNVMTDQLAEARSREVSARQAVETGNAYLESVLRNLSAGVLVFDEKLRLKVANASAAVILQTPLDPVRETFLPDWQLRTDALHSFADLARRGMTQARDGQWQRESEILISGNARSLLLRGTRLPDGGSVVVFDDVTEVIQAQRDTAWAEVARRLAHEIKNPLTPIQLSAERLAHKLTPGLTPEQAHVLGRGTDTIVAQVTAMKEMVNDFAVYARRPKPGSMQSIDVRALLSDVISLYEAQHEAGTLRPELHLHWTSDIALVNGESTRLRQVFHNLLQNATDATLDAAAHQPPIPQDHSPENVLLSDYGQTEPRPPSAWHPRIDVHASRDVSDLIISFADNGRGFSEEVKKRAFEPYVTTKPKGTGLGLAIVKKIIDEHHGRISIDNLPEGGASVTVHLPLSTRESSQPATLAQKPNA